MCSADLTRVGYVLKRYPRYSETFIVNEILAHEAAGLELAIFTLLQPNDSHFQDTIARIEAPVRYLPTEGLRADVFWNTLQSVSAELPELWQALPATRGEDIRHVYQALLLAQEARRQGIDHLHAHFATSATTVARLAARFAGLTYSFTAHAKDIFHESVQPDDVRRNLVTRPPPSLSAITTFTAPCVIGEDSNRDGLPTVLLEAMALGTPCVGTNITGIPEVVRDGETGLIVPQRDPAALALALALALARLLDDPALRVVLTTAARHLIETEFAVGRNSARLRAIFQQVCQARTSEAARGRIHVVPNGVCPERFAGAARERQTSSFTVGFVGSLKPWHGLPILVEAFARLHEVDSDARLLIVGDGVERTWAEADLARRGLREGAHFTGAVAPEAIPALLAEMDVAVAPYPRLPDFYFSPLKVYEYMAAGLPVVASRIGQLDGLIDHGHTGLLCPPGDPGALAEALIWLRHDLDLRAALGWTASTAVLGDHTWDAVAGRVLRIARAAALGLEDESSLALAI